MNAHVEFHEQLNQQVNVQQVHLQGFTPDQVAQVVDQRDRTHAAELCLVQERAAVAAAAMATAAVAETRSEAERLHHDEVNRVERENEARLLSLQQQAHAAVVNIEAQRIHLASQLEDAMARESLVQAEVRRIEQLLHVQQNTSSGIANPAPFLPGLSSMSPPRDLPLSSPTPFVSHNPTDSAAGPSQTNQGPWAQPRQADAALHAVSQRRSEQPLSSEIPTVAGSPAVLSGRQTQFYELSPVSVATEFGHSAASPAPTGRASGIPFPSGFGTSVPSGAGGIGAPSGAAVPRLGAATSVPSGAGGMRAPIGGAATHVPSGAGDMNALRCRRCQTVLRPMARFCDICGFALSEAAGYRSDATMTGPTGSSHGQDVGRTGIGASQAAAPANCTPTTSPHTVVCGAPGRHETFVHDSGRDLWPNSAEVVPLGDGDHQEPLSSRAPALIGCLCRVQGGTDHSGHSGPPPILSK